MDIVSGENRHRRPDERAEIEATGLFEDVTITQFDWELTYNADQYIDLLNTFSGHIAMAPWGSANACTERSVVGSVASS